ncbi:MAG: VanW family protein [Patescibacteria group bacterium]|nr:VanW family protein [Patescibacteria group bacterium]
MKIPRIKPKHFLHLGRVIFWFSTGALLALFFITSFSFLIFKNVYKNVVYPGVMINGVNFGGKTEIQVYNYFKNKNYQIKDINFVFTSDKGLATASAEQIDFGYNSSLLANQAFNLGKTNNLISNISLIVQAYVNGINLTPSYSYSQDKLATALSALSEKIEDKPVDALFTFANNRVTAFRPSVNGHEIDKEALGNQLLSKALAVVSSQKGMVFIIPLQIKVIEPKITIDKANDLGIKELIGEGHSLFFHSIPSRIHNVALGASRLNGVLVAPGEVFSFDKALGDVSAFTGYQQAYVIQNGKTVLGDGGGICQVSTTFFRALLNAGLPIVERNAHAYRVGYYEEDSPPGLDATIFVPSVDLKFKNDTGNYILIQSQVDLDNLSLAFYLYGTKDGRQVSMTKPVVSNITPAPPDLYQDDPTLPKGQIKQTDFAAAGADVYFTRTVTKNGKQIIYDKFVSNYRPWQAIYLRGTKE